MFIESDQLDANHSINEQVSQVNNGVSFIYWNEVEKSAKLLGMNLVVCCLDQGRENFGSAVFDDPVSYLLHDGILVALSYLLIEGLSLFFHYR